MNSDVKQKTEIRVKGPYRIINYCLTGRPIFISHPQFKRLMTAAGGRLPLAGVPSSIDLDLTVKFEATTHWRDKNPVAKVSDLTEYPIKGLATGVVFVEEVQSTFLFYGNAWFHLDQTLRNTEEVSEDEEGQKRFSKSIADMEKSAKDPTLKTGSPMRSFYNTKPNATRN